MKRFMSYVTEAKHLSALSEEATVYFRAEPAFDQNPDLFQLENCVLDLKAHTFRRTRPSDMCQRSSPLSLPEEWLLNPRIMQEEASPLIRKAWDVLASMFSRCHQCPAGTNPGD